MPDGPTLSSFGIQVFYRCESLALTRLPDGLTSIRQYAFQSSCYKQDHQQYQSVHGCRAGCLHLLVDAVGFVIWVLAFIIAPELALALARDWTDWIWVIDLMDTLLQCTTTVYFYSVLLQCTTTVCMVLVYVMKMPRSVGLVLVCCVLLASFLAGFLGV